MTAPPPALSQFQVAVGTGQNVVSILGLFVLSATIGTGVAVCYRWYTRQQVPEGVAVLFGVAGIAVWLNTTAALQSAIGGSTDLLDPATALFTLAAYAAGAIGADAGRRVGDRFAGSFFDVTRVRDLDDVTEFVRTAGRATVVELPETVDDIEGFDPVAPEKKAEIAAETFRFPHRLTVAELRDRLVARLRDDYGIGHVDVELAADGTVEYLGVGARVAGIGPTLPPGTVAAAIRADPAKTASPGDTVQVWTTGPDARRLVTAELRAAAEDVVTLALDPADAESLDPRQRYRLVTLPTEPRADHEFASLLRAAPETMGAATVRAGSDLDGVAVGALDTTVVAIGADDGVEAIPKRRRVLAPGDTVYVVARPEALRRFEAAAGAEAEGTS